MSLSPPLFNCALEPMFRNLERNYQQIGLNINNLRFADDVIIIIIIMTSAKQITDMIHDIHRESEKTVLKINTN